MLYKYKTSYLRISPRKMRFIVPAFINKKADFALQTLELRPEKGAFLILKCLRSAISASKNRGAIEEDLKIKAMMIDEGPRLKRRLIKPRGRADLIMKRMSHITIVLKDKRKRKKKIDQKSKI